MCPIDVPRPRPCGPAACARPLAALLAAALAAILPAPAARAGDAPDDAVAEERAATPPAAPAAQAPPKPAEVVFDELSVVGGPAGVVDVPGSAHVIGKLELVEQRHSDVHRILSRVPGVVMQEEEGYGLRPNIGMRGSGTERSSKITLLEDGVLIAPAPYAAPAAYYFPTPGRMEAFEVRKGSSAIRQGPYTVGGVLNLVSTSIPPAAGGRVEGAYGEHATRRLHAFAGDSGERFGWLLETYQLATDGFKDLDGGGPTGFELEDYTAKLRWTSRRAARVFQAVELKVGTVGQDSSETYLGLTDGDFRRTPYRRYAASAEDHLDTDHDQVQLTWLIQPSAAVDVTTTVYRNDFFRNWYKLQSVSGRGLGDVLENPAAFAPELAVLRGEADSADGALDVRANRRDYYAEGVQSVLTVRPGGGGRGAAHRLDFGVRVHRDQEDRFQHEDGYRMDGGRLVLTDPGSPGSQDNRVSSAEAVALFAQDTVTAGRWTLTPGLRFESIDYRRENYGRNDPERSGANLSAGENGVNVWIPGLGVAYRASDSLRVFGGVHRGFAPPGPGRDEETEAEESVNYELGLRTAGRPLAIELVGFYNDYDNLLGADTLSSGGGGTGELFNGGAVEVLGLEAAARWDLGRARGWALEVPLRLAYTWTEAEFQTSFETDFADWAPAVERGDELPYLPEHQLAAGAGLVGEAWGAHLDLTWVDEMRTTAGRGAIPAGEGADAHLVLDLSARYRFRFGLEAFVQVRNLTDEVYVAARRPAGARPGLPRTALVGLSWDF